MFEYRYEIADIPFAIRFPFAYAHSYKFDPFRTERQPELFYLFTVLEQQPFFDVPPVMTQNFRVYKQKGILYQELRSGVSAYSCVLHESCSAKYRTVWLYPRVKEKNLFPQDDEVFEALDFPWMLNSKEALFLHASFIAWQGTGILFTAPSQTGKSTQADLWKTAEKARIINGDRAILRKKEGVWHAYGSPYAGSSEVFLNENYPIRTIVVLRQGDRNQIQQLSQREAFIWLYSEMVSRPWDEPYREREISLIENLVSSVPVYQFSCLPDSSAVDALKRVII